MADIKTRDAVTGTIKAIDKSAVAAERMKDAFIRTKDDAQRGASSAEDSPEKYAADKVTSLAETTASRTAQEYLCIQYMMIRLSSNRIAPFGNLRI